MDEVYGNSYVTLAICSSRKAMEQIPHFREAWRYKAGACQLYSGHWLSNVDMSLNEIRLRSDLFTRGLDIAGGAFDPSNALCVWPEDVLVMFGLSTC